MNKKFLIAAVGAALAAGPMMVANAASSALYGHVHMSLDRYDNDDQGGGAERGYISSNSTRFGIKGDEDLGGGLKAIYQIETGGIAMDTGASGLGGTLRNSFLGVSGGFGAVKIGRHDTPFKDLGRVLDSFNEQVGDARNAIGSGGVNSWFNWDQRVSNTVRYESPTFAGVQVTAQYATGEGSSTMVASNTANDVVSLGARWTSGPILVGLAHETHRTQTSEDETGLRLVGRYDFGMADVGLFFEQLKDLEGTAGSDLKTMGVAANLKMGNDKVKLHYYKIDDLDGAGGGNGTGGSLLAVGFDHAFSKTATVYVNYAKADNDNNANFVNVASANGGHGNAHSLPGTDGKSPSGFSAGMIVKF